MPMPFTVELFELMVPSSSSISTFSMKSFNNSRELEESPLPLQLYQVIPLTSAL
jgi:hypothetical protein